MPAPRARLMPSAGSAGGKGHPAEAGLSDGHLPRGHRAVFLSALIATRLLPDVPGSTRFIPSYPRQAPRTCAGKSRLTQTIPAQLRQRSTLYPCRAASADFSQGRLDMPSHKKFLCA